jgi:hypothetical protein
VQVTEEPFLDLSLPIPSITPLTHPAPAAAAATGKGVHATRLKGDASEETIRGIRGQAAATDMEVDPTATSSGARHDSSGGEEESTSTAPGNSKKHKGKKGRQREEAAAAEGDEKQGGKSKGKAKVRATPAPSVFASLPGQLLLVLHASLLLS